MLSAKSASSDGAYTPWSTGGDNDDTGLLTLPNTQNPELFMTESADLETPAWVDFSENECGGGWDYELSTQLAAKLLMIDSNAGQLKEQDSEGSVNGGAAYANPRFKTEFCRNFKEKGSCLYGDLCQFAHGKHELRKDVVRHNKYKTKLCQKFWILGYCAYGPRCNFVHNESDVYQQGSAGQMYPGLDNSGLVPSGGGSGRYRDFHVSYRKTSLGDSGGDSGSEQGSVPPAAIAYSFTPIASRRRLSPPPAALSPPPIFHPEHNPLPSIRATKHVEDISSNSLQLLQGFNGNCSLGRGGWDPVFY